MDSEIISFFNDVTNKKFKTRKGKKIYHDKIKVKKDQRYKKVKKWIKEN